MKKLILILLSIPILSISQTVWSPGGAVWYYNYSNNFTTEGYVKIEYIQDSLFNGRNCNVLLKSRHTYNYETQQFANDSIGLEFTYEQNNKIYFYRLGEFKILYDFSLAPGDDMIITGFSMQECIEYGSIIIDNIENVSVNSLNLIKQNIQKTDTSIWDLGSAIIERIGSVGYMFPELSDCITDLNEGGNLRCYYDNELGWYQIGSQDCDYITKINDISNDNINLIIYPNPSKGGFSIRLNSMKDSELSIIDITGKTIYHDVFTNEINISTTEFKKGIYFVKIKNNDKVIIKKIIAD